MQDIAFRGAETLKSAVFFGWLKTKDCDFGVSPRHPGVEPSQPNWCLLFYWDPVGVPKAYLGVAASTTGKLNQSANRKNVKNRWHCPDPGVDPAGSKWCLVFYWDPKGMAIANKPGLAQKPEKPYKCPIWKWSKTRCHYSDPGVDPAGSKWVLVFYWDPEGMAIANKPVVGLKPQKLFETAKRNFTRFWLSLPRPKFPRWPTWIMFSILLASRVHA